jgi:hypothetical protein
MRFMQAAALIFALALYGMSAALATPTVDVASFVKKDRFHDIKLSPTGDYYAATVLLEDQTGLAIIRRADNVMTGSFRLGKNTHVADFWWVNKERVHQCCREVRVTRSAAADGRAPCDQFRRHPSGIPDRPAGAQRRAGDQDPAEEG